MAEGRLPRPSPPGVWGVAAALCLAVAGLAPGRASAAPKLSVPTPRLEIGALTAGETAEVEFPLVNAGTELLKITQVTTSCGCTTTSYPATLPPGEKGVLKAKLASNVLWNGTVEKHITVRSNDPEQPSVDLQLVAQIRPLLQFTPQNPTTIPYKKGEVIRQVFTITPATEPPVRITAVTANGPGTEARLLPAESGDKPGVSRVEVTVHPPERAGDFSTSVTLQTTNPRAPAIPLTVIAVSQDAITVSPSFLYLGHVGTTPNSDAPRLLLLFKRSGTFRVLGVQTDTGALKAEMRESDTRLPGGTAPQATGGGRSYYEIAVRYMGGWTKGQAAGKVVVTTDDPQSPKLEIPCQATVD